MKAIVSLLALGAILLGSALIYRVNIQEDPPVTATAQPAPVTPTSTTARTPQTYELQEKDNGTTLKVKAGDTVVLRLPTNYSTGYGWKIDNTSAPSAVQVGKIVDIRRPAPPGPPRLGAGSEIEIRCQAQAVGSSTIELSYRRGGQGTAAKTFKVTIEVEP